MTVNAGDSLEGFRSERILAWLDPESYAQGKGFHIFSYACMGLCVVMFLALIVIYFIDKKRQYFILLEIKYCP